MYWRTSSLILPVLALLNVAVAADEPQAPKPDTIAIIRLDRPITDKPMSDDPLFGTAAPEALRDLVQRFKKAADDPKVAAVVVLWGENGLGRGLAEELLQAFDKVKASKPIYAHADSLTTGGYTVLSNASRLSVSPTGDVWVTGIYGEQLYLRGLLDLLKVQPDFLTCGEYKSAAETFMRSGPSEAASEMYGWLYDGIFDAMMAHMARGRDVDATKVREWIKQGLFSSEAAQQKGLIDAVETREDLTATLKKEFGAAVKFDHKYGKKTGPEIDLNNPFAALQLWAQILGASEPRKSTKDAIAVVHIDGSIQLGNPQPSLFGSSDGAYSEEIRKALDKVADDPRVRAVVLRVNSPGGSATASEIMAQAALRVKSKKPFVVSMGDVAASGGYYVSCEADRIFANESTITGSIGVLGGKLATGAMWKRVGINFHPIQRGEKSGVFGMAEPFTQDERDELQAWMDDVYKVFRQHVQTGRGEHLTKPLEEMTGGRVFTGKQALELGLVDELGTLEDAITYAALQAKVEDYEIRTVPRAKNLFEQLFEDLGQKKKDDEPRLSMWGAILPHLDGLDPFHVDMMRDAVRQLDQLRAGQVLMTLPVFRIQEGPLSTR